jgi:hypothetical protein
MHALDAGSQDAKRVPEGKLRQAIEVYARLKGTKHVDRLDFTAVLKQVDKHAPALRSYQKLRTLVAQAELQPIDSPRQIFHALAKQRSKEGHKQAASRFTKLCEILAVLGDPNCEFPSLPSDSKFHELKQGASKPIMQFIQRLPHPIPDNWPEVIAMRCNSPPC